MNVGFIGAGRMTQRRMVNLPEDCEAVAVYAHDAITDRYTGVNIDELLVPSPEKVIEMADLVVIATPHAYLWEYAWDASAKRVFVEKPGGVPGDSVLPPGTRVGYNHRFWPGIQAAKAAATAPVLHIRGVYGHGNADRLWRMNPKLSGGGELLDQGSHLIDLSRVFMGKIRPLAYHPTTEAWECEVEDTALLVLENAAGATATLHVSWCEWSPVFRFEVITEAEKIVVEGFPWELQTVSTTTRQGESSFEMFNEDRSLRLELEDMLGDGETGATVEDATAVLAIVEQAYA